MKIESIQQEYTRYIEAICTKIQEWEKEDLGVSDPIELKNVKAMWEWFRNAAHEEELVATIMVAELTQP